MDMPAPVDENRILSAALAVWREEGFRHATTRKVAERACVGEVTLFRRFGDKTALFGAALATETDRFQALGANYSGDLVADLLAIVSAYQDLLNRNGSIVLDFLIEAPKNPELIKIGALPLQAIQQVASLIARHQATGALSKGEPLVLVTSLLGPLVMRFAVGRAQPVLQSAFSAEEVVDAFVSGWKNPGGPGSIGLASIQARDR